MEIKGYCNFKDLPIHIQTVIRNHRLIKTTGHCTIDNTLLTIYGPQRESNESRDYIIDKEDLIFYFFLSNIHSQLPEWLDKVQCSFEISDIFVGDLVNGLFRYGNSKAAVSSFADHKIIDTVQTKIEIIAKGIGKTTLRQVFKFYRKLRSGDVDSKWIIDIWW
jgi:hypothetical protein